MFQKIIAFSIKNKALVFFFMLLLLIWGGYSLTKLPIDAIPDVTNNQVVILTQSPALATEEMERYITTPLELKMTNLQGVTEIRSTSRQGLSVITVVFEEDIGMYLARQMVAEQIKSAEADIPASFGQPELAPITTGLGEIYQYTLVPRKGAENKYSLTELRTLQDWVVKRQLSGVSGVIEISSFGGFVKQYEIKILPERLMANGISVDELFTAVQKSNANIGGSYIEKDNQAYFIRGEGIAKSYEEIGQIVVTNKGGTPVLVRDVAEVGEGYATRYGAMTRNGESEAVGGIVLMLKGADSEKTIKEVKARIAQIEKSLPDDLDISAFIDRTKLIDKSISTVEKNLIEGGLIVIFVLVLLMGSIRAGLLVASVIPFTMLITFGIMESVGISANLMSLGALDFGLLVDCSVIVVEAVLFKLHHDKKFKVPKVESSTMDKMVETSASTVLSSAVFGGLIILIVYLPILSLQGVEGKMFKPMAMTVSIAISVAVLLSLTYIPAGAAMMLRKEGNKHFAFSDKVVNAMFGVYKPLINKALQLKAAVLSIAFALFLVALFIFTRLGGEFIPTLDEGDLAVDFQTSPGSSLTATIDATLEAQRSLLKHFPEVKQIVGRIGASEVPTDPMPPEMADLMINLKDHSEWTSASSREELVEKMAAVLEEEVPGTSVEFTQPIQMRFNEMIAGARSEIVVKIFGEDLNVLADMAAHSAKAIENLEGIASIKVERVAGLPQINVQYDRNKLAIYGLQIDELNTLLNTAFSGNQAGLIFENEKRFDMVLRLDESFRTDIENVRQLPVKLPSGQFMPLEALAQIEYKTGPAQISREGTRRRINIGISVLNRDVESLVSEIQQTLSDKVSLPTGYYFAYGGAFENLQKAKKRLGIAVPAALLLIFGMLYFTFSSVKQSLMIFTAIPLSAIGGVFALWLRGMPFSISAGVGFIALFGVAVLNGIVLIGYLNELEKTTDLNPLERVKEGVKVRFRPVMMTALVASLGFLPMAISTSAGAEVQKPLATVVIGGLISATLLTLVVLPVLYLLFTENRKVRLSKSVAAILLLVLMGTLPSNGQTSLPELLEMAENGNLDLQLAAEQIKIAEQKVSTGKAVAPTSFSFQYGNIQNIGDLDYNIGVQHGIINPAKNRALADVYRAQIGEKESEKDWQKNMVFRRIRQLYYELYYYDVLKGFISNQSQVYEELLQYATARVNAGEGSAVESISASNQLSSMESKLLITEGKEQQSRVELTSLLQVEELPDLAFNALNKSIVPGVDSNPEIQVLQSRQETAGQEFNWQKTQRKPDFSVDLYNQSMLGSFRQFYVGAGVIIPLAKKTLEAKEESLKLTQAYLGKQIETRQKQLAASLEALSRNQQSLELSISHYEQKQIPDAQDLADKLRLRYRAGEATYLEYQQALTQKYQLLEELANLKYTYYLNQTEILWLAGQ